MTLTHRKFALIEQIVASEQEELIEAMEAFVQRFSRPALKLDFSKHGNIKKSVDLEELKQKRPLKPFNMDEFKKETDALVWDASLNELLEQLD